jgi:transcriptional regulator with XRE-family HTH domain
MGFRENLRAELNYADMCVKELAARTGIKKGTIDGYLREKGYTPSVDIALRIARALGVTVEYLVTGNENPKGKALSGLSPELRGLLQTLMELSDSNRRIVIKNASQLAESLKEREVDAAAPGAKFGAKATQR